MTSFKSGSGDLNFDADDDDEEETTTSEQETGSEAESETVDDTERSERSEPATEAEYPYFVRRSNVTDERERRIEIHLRPAIQEQEAAFRRDLADALDTDDVAKTDAREFALQFAFNHPEQVAELMREEGFGVLE